MIDDVIDYCIIDIIINTFGYYINYMYKGNASHAIARGPIEDTSQHYEYNHPFSSLMVTGDGQVEKPNNILYPTFMESSPLPRQPYFMNHPSTRVMQHPYQQPLLPLLSPPPPPSFQLNDFTTFPCNTTVQQQREMHINCYGGNGKVLNIVYQVRPLPPLAGLP